MWLWFLPAFVSSSLTLLLQRPQDTGSVSFCLLFFLQLMLTGTAQPVLPSRQQGTGNSQFLYTNSYLPYPPFHTLPHQAVTDEPPDAELWHYTAPCEEMTSLGHRDRNSQPFFVLTGWDGHYFWKSATGLMVASEFLCSSTESTNTQTYLLQDLVGFSSKDCQTPNPPTVSNPMWCCPGWYGNAHCVNVFHMSVCCQYSGFKNQLAMCRHAARRGAAYVEMKWFCEFWAQRILLSFKLCGFPAPLQPCFRLTFGLSVELWEIWF